VVTLRLVLTAKVAAVAVLKKILLRLLTVQEMAAMVSSL
jgi:hypothetical protein